MAEKIIIETEIKNDQPIGQVKNLKQQIKELKQQQSEAAQAFGAGSKEVVQLSKELAELKALQDELNRTTRAYDPNPLNRGAVAIKAVASGFQAAQGAAALFGSESEDVQKALLKVQGAMAFSGGIRDMMDLTKSFNLFSGKSIPGVLKGLFSVRGAIIATGVGALVVAVGMLMANWEALTDTFTKSFPGLAKIGEFFKNWKQQLAGFVAGAIEGFKVVGEIVTKFFKADFQGAIDAAKGAGSRVAEAFNKGYEEKDKEIQEENALKRLNRELDLLEAQGVDVRRKKIELLRREQAALDKQSDEWFQKQIEIERIRTALRNEETEKRTKAEKEAREKELKNYYEWTQKIKKDEEARVKREKELAKQRRDVRKEQRDYERQTAFDEVNDIRLSYDDRLKALEQYTEKGLIYEEEAVRLRASLLQQQTDAYYASATQITGIVANLGNALTGNAEAQRAIAIAQTIVDTYFAAQKAYLSQMTIPSPDAPVRAKLAAAAAIASGLARVQQMRRVNIKSPTPVNPTTDGGFNPPPAFQASVGSQVVGAGDLRLTNQPQRVFVVESDITNTQNRVKTIETNATIGG
jgi:hypothetical protein